ncbi:hypothetical protein HK104_010231 [Borealophlyctis nickersoniae]|nr:hypothetical protein HK104_010231 [Borealophlyctis nickersoniae]
MKNIFQRYEKYKSVRRENIIEDSDPIETTIPSPPLRDLSLDIVSRRQSLVIAGPAGCGKVKWVIKNSPKPLYVVRSSEDLHGFNKFMKQCPNYIKSMLFIQMDFNRLPSEKQGKVLESENGSAHVPYRGHTAHIPVEIRKTFVWNGDRFPFGEDAGVRRRMHVVNALLGE